MKTDQVHATRNTLKQCRQRLDMSGRIIQSFEEDVFERDAPLMRKIILPQQSDQVGERVSLFDRHQGQTFFGERRMQADGQMTGAFVEKTAQTFGHPDGRYRNPLGAPAVTVRLGQYFKHVEQFVRIVERLTHPHKDDVRELV